MPYCLFCTVCSGKLRKVPGTHCTGTIPDESPWLARGWFRLVAPRGLGMACDLQSPVKCRRLCHRSVHHMPNASAVVTVRMPSKYW